MYLPDPRTYPRVNPNNPTIRALMAWQTASDAESATLWRTQLDATLRDLIAAGDHAGLNAALTQIPSQDSHQRLWDVLSQELSEAPEACERWLTLFAIPVILVAGTRNQVALKAELDDVAPVLDAMRAAGVIATDAEVTLSPALISPVDMAALSLTDQQRARATCDVATLAARLPASSVTVKDEGVFVRYLIGAATETAGADAAIRLGSDVGSWGIKVAEAINAQLAVDGLTLFAIPRGVQNWLAAQETGRITQLETRLQVSASNALRSIRGKGRTPAVVIAAHEPGEVRVTFTAREDAERWEAFVWPLGPLDRTEGVRHYAENLLAECQVDDIQVIDTVQPDLDVDGLPYFVTAHKVAPQ
ncbi:DUF2863 family protein [Chitinibacteraceae bacterium HSL-7]